MTENKIAIDVAEDAFAEFLEANELDFDTSTMDAEDSASFAKVKATVIRAICRGILAIDPAGQPVMTLDDGSTITFREPTGANIMEMDKVKKGDVAKMHAVLKSMCQVDPGIFAKMPHRRYKVAQAILMLFMA